MEPDKHYLRRLGILFGIFCMCAMLFGAVLYDAQVVHYEDYYKQSTSRIADSEIVTASRGILTDRNGKVLVSNRQVYTITFDSSELDEDDDPNYAILRLIQLSESFDVVWDDNLPISKEAPYTYTTADTTDIQRSRFQKFLAKCGWSEKEITETSPYPRLTAEAMADTGLTNANISAGDLLELMRDYFEIDDSLPMSEARKIIGVRYELAIRSIVNTTAYVFASEVDTRMISILSDGDYAGVVVGTQSVREYNTQYAAHILGRIGSIGPEDLEAYKAQGYQADDLVGLEGVDSSKVVIGYEPVWSIGPGKTPAGKDYITKVARLVKRTLGDVPVVYGGGLKEENAEMLASIDEIDGGLVALTRFSGEIGFYSDEFLNIVRLYLGRKAKED